MSYCIASHSVVTPQYCMCIISFHLSAQRGRSVAAGRHRIFPPVRAALDSFRALSLSQHILPRDMDTKLMDMLEHRIERDGLNRTVFDTIPPSNFWSIFCTLMARHDTFFGRLNVGRLLLSYAT